MLLIGKNRCLLAFGFVLFFSFIFTPVLVAEVPNLISYQGYLTDTAGNPVPDGNYSMNFQLCTTESGESGVWAQTMPAVSVVDGIYNVELGPFIYPEQVFDGDLYLEVEVNGEVFTPRQRLGATAYAMRAVVADGVADGALTVNMLADDAVTTDKIADSTITGDNIANASIPASDIQDGSGSGLDADTLDGMQASYFLTAAHDHDTRYVNATGDTMTGLLDVSAFNIGSGYLEAIRGTLTTTTNGSGLHGTSNGTNSHGVHGSATGIDGVGVFGEVNGARAYGVQGVAAGEIGRAVVGLATSTSGFPNFGGYFEAGGGTSRAVYGHATNNGDWGNWGGWFEADGSQGRGVYGIGSYAGGDFKSNGSSGAGVRAYADGADAYGVFAISHNGDGIWAMSHDEDGRGVYGEATGNNGNGLHGISSGNYSRAVYGEATYTGPTTTHGGYFMANSENGRGVFGGSTGATGRGVFGWASNTGADTNYGGYFRADGENGIGIYAIGGPSGYAGEFKGTIRAEEIIVETGWADHVFQPKYKMMDLDQLDVFIKNNGHLPGIPTELEVKKKGVPVGEMQVNLLEKIEELTLHMIEQSKKIKSLESIVAELSANKAFNK